MPTKDYESRISARIDSDLYYKLHDAFHHGQQTQFFRCIFKSLVKLIEDKRWVDVTEYMYNNKDLTLPKVEDD